MAKFVIAGRADCPVYAKAEMLADTLATNLPDFRVHKVVLSPEDWPSWVQEQCQQRGWTHCSTSSPLIWRELIDRGGKGSYVGGLAQFADYSKHYYDTPSPISDEVAMQISMENSELFQSLTLNQHLHESTPLHVCLTAGSSPVAYHIASLLLSRAVFKDRSIVIHLYDHPDQLHELEGVAMELTDLAHPQLSGVVFTSSLQEAFKMVSAVFVLDHPYQSPVEQTGLPEAAIMFYRYAAMLDYCAEKDVRVIVAGCYSNTGTAIMASTVSSISKSCFIASSSLVERQASSVLADKLGVASADLQQVSVWGSCQGSISMDTTFTKVRHYQGSITGPDPFTLPLYQCLFDHQWLQEVFPAMLSARHQEREGYGGRDTSLAIAASLCQLMEKWWDGNVADWCSVGVVSEGGQYGVEEGIVFSQPCVCREGVWQAVDGLSLSDQVSADIQKQVSMLRAELSTAAAAVKQHTGYADPTHSSKL